MRTTVRLDETLLLEAKRYAAEQGKTLNKVIEEALREKLASAYTPKPFRRVTFESGLQPGVNLDDNAATLELMEEGLELDARR